MSQVLHRHTHLDPPVAVGGEGVYIVDADGRRYLDASGGAAVSCLGHGHPKVIQAIKRQIDRIAYAHTAFFTTEPLESLADWLVARAPGTIHRAYFTCGGSEAVEAAVKLARQYFIEIGQPQRRHLIARRQSYHGTTLGALAVGGNAWRRAPFAPLLVEVGHIAPCYAYRGQRDGENAPAYGRRVADELEAEIQRLGADTVIAFVAEPVVGGTLGAVPSVPGYFPRIREICDRHGVLLILDEVMCGMGRTGSLFACEQDGVAPDMVTVAKGLAGGYQPIGAVLVAKHIFEAVRDGSGFFLHGQTYMGHATACAAALAVQRTIEEENLLDRVRHLGAALARRLEARFGNHHHVGDIRGRGLFQAIELVADRGSKETFDPAARLNVRIKNEALARGLICYPLGGTADGRRGDHVLLAPPFIITETQLDEAVDKLGQAVDAAIGSIGA